MHTFLQIHTQIYMYTHTYAPTYINSNTRMHASTYMYQKKWIQQVAMISTNSRIALPCFLKATRFYQVGDHLICIWAVIICMTLRDQMVIKCRGCHLEFLCFPACLWMMHTWGHLKGKPHSPFSQFSPQYTYTYDILIPKNNFWRLIPNCTGSLVGEILI